MARQPALKKSTEKKCTLQHGAWHKKKRGKGKGKWVYSYAGALKKGCKIKNGEYYQVRKFRDCKKKRKKAMHEGVVVVAPCGKAVTSQLLKRARGAIEDKKWRQCAKINAAAVKEKKKKGQGNRKPPCRVIFFKATGKPIMRGLGKKGSMKREAMKRWKARSKTFQRKFVGHKFPKSPGRKSR